MTTIVIVLLVIGVLLILGTIFYYRKTNKDFIDEVDKSLNTLSNESLERKLKSYREIVADEKQSTSARSDAKRMVRRIEEKIREKKI